MNAETNINSGIFAKSDLLNSQKPSESSELSELTECSELRSQSQGLSYEEIFEQTMQKLTKFKINNIADTNLKQIVYDNKQIYITVYILGLNSTLSVKLSEDKKLTYNLFSLNNVPITPHELIININNKLFNSEDNLAKAMKLFEEWGSLALKPNCGSQGNNICFVRNREELKEKFTFFEKEKKNIVISPFRDIKHEYRAIVLRNKNTFKFEIICLLKKSHFTIIGNGHDTIEQLIRKKKFHEGLQVDKIIDEYLSFLSQCKTCDKDTCKETSKYTNKDTNKDTSKDSRKDDSYDLKSKVLKKNEEFECKYKLNWSYGASLARVKNFSSNKKYKEIIDLLNHALSYVTFNFGCIDILETEDGLLEILETNTSVITSLYDYLETEELIKFIDDALMFRFDIVEKNTYNKITYWNYNTESKDINFSISKKKASTVLEALESQKNVIEEILIKNKSEIKLLSFDNYYLLQFRREENEKNVEIMVQKPINLKYFTNYWLNFDTQLNYEAAFLYFDYYKVYRILENAGIDAIKYYFLDFKNQTNYKSLVDIIPNILSNMSDTSINPEETMLLFRRINETKSKFITINTFIQYIEKEKKTKKYFISNIVEYTQKYKIIILKNEICFILEEKNDMLELVENTENLLFDKIKVICFKVIDVLRIGYFQIEIIITESNVPTISKIITCPKVSFLEKSNNNLYKIFIEKMLKESNIV